MNIVFLVLICLISTGCYWTVYTVTTMGWLRTNHETGKRYVDWKGHFDEFKSLIIPMTIMLIGIYVLSFVVFL